MKNKDKLRNLWDKIKGINIALLGSLKKKKGNRKLISRNSNRKFS